MPMPEAPAAPAAPEAKVTVRHMGREGEPLVVIDDFSGTADALREAAQAAPYQHGGAFYPGLRAPADAGYLDRRRDLLSDIMQRVFGFTQGMRLEAASYSLVTLPGDQLSAIQRIPHYDDASGAVIAVMHYLLGPDSGGTAFYRHRRTGFEAITPEREAGYRAALNEDGVAHGMPPAQYCHGDGAMFELIDEVEPAPDRFVMYRGRQLHSGVIPDASRRSSDPAQGRLTINMFLIGA